MQRRQQEMARLRVLMVLPVRVVLSVLPPVSVLQMLSVFLVLKELLLLMPVLPRLMADSFLLPVLAFPMLSGRRARR